MALTVHYYNRNGEQIIDCKNVCPNDVEFFRKNDIKVSMEELNGEIIVYGCPYSDVSEESEVIVFAKNRSCEETLSELVSECKQHFGVES
jgi:hypothetical protein